MLEAGLAAYQGKALVNSVTAEDERLDAILPLVKRHGAAVIALPNDEEEIPEDPRRRLELARKIVDVATGRYGIPIEDIVFDPLAMPVGADTSMVLTHAGDDLAGARRVRREHDAGRLQRLVRHAGPARDRRGVPADGDRSRADHRDHGRPLTAAGQRGQGGRPAANRDAWGAAWIAAHRARQAAAAAADLPASSSGEAGRYPAE